MILYLHKATQKPYMETWIAMTRGARPQLLTEKKQTAQSLSHIRCRFELHSYDGASSIQGLSAIFLHSHNRRHELVVTEPYETNGRRSITVDL